MMRKDAASDAADAVQDTADDAADAVAEKADEVKDNWPSAASDDPAGPIGRKSAGRR